MPVYFLAAVDRNDVEAYREYEAGAWDSLKGQDFEALALSDNLDMLEGSAPSQRLLLLKFKDRAGLERWWRSPAYQKVVPMRHQHADTKFIVAFEGLK